ncbi:DnaJ domain-containing protein [Aspergillus cavernicola]|uniref:DnaJ domain-containing protein n=1 Tax=Aspergillus cavernicola TaxID=176166 RepID=A0ABR4I7C1_9EURO
MDHDYYAILGVPRTADSNAIKAAYKKLALTKHPDRNNKPNATAEFQLISEAYDTLINAEKRRIYDADCTTATKSPGEDVKNRQIAELTTWLQRLQRDRSEQEAAVQKIHIDIPRLSEEITRIEEEKDRILSEQAAEEKWVVSVTAALLGRRGDLAQKRQLRERAMSDLMERQRTNEEAVKDKLANIPSLRAKIEYLYSMEDKLKAQIKSIEREWREGIFGWNFEY